MSSAIDAATIGIQSKIGEFTGIFAPQSDDTKIILAIFDALTLMMGFTVSAFYSVGKYKGHIFYSKASRL